MKNQERTVVYYSYFDNESGQYHTSSDGIVIEGEVTPQKLRNAVLSKWKKTGYYADAGSIEIETQENLV